MSIPLPPPPPPFFFRNALVPQLMLSLLGFKSTETGRVSEEELRLIVTGAKQSGGIESEEGMMIEGVLDLQVSPTHVSPNDRTMPPQAIRATARAISTV